MWVVDDKNARNTKACVNRKPARCIHRTDLFRTSDASDDCSEQTIDQTHIHKANNKSNKLHFRKDETSRLLLFRCLICRSSLKFTDWHDYIDGEIEFGQVSRCTTQVAGHEFLRLDFPTSRGHRKHERDQQPPASDQLSTFQVGRCGVFQIFRGLLQIRT